MATVTHTFVSAVSDDPTAAAAGEVLPSHWNAGHVVSVNATDVGLGNVTNTSDANKPVSTAQQTALNLKADLASPTFTGTVGGITKTMVGLGSVDNTADASKPVSTAQQTALNLKLNLTGGTLSGPLGFNAEYDNGNSSTAITLTLATAQKQKVTLNSATPTLTISTTSAAVGNYQIRIVQDGTGSRVPTFSGLSSSRWLGSASAPAVSAGASTETILSIYFDGTNLTQSMTKVGS